MLTIPQPCMCLPSKKQVTPLARYTPYENGYLMESQALIHSILNRQPVAKQCVNPSNSDFFRTQRGFKTKGRLSLQKLQRYGTCGDGFELLHLICCITMSIIHPSTIYLIFFSLESVLDVQAMPQQRQQPISQLCVQ